MDLLVPWDGRRVCEEGEKKGEGESGLERRRREGE